MIPEPAPLPSGPIFSPSVEMKAIEALNSVIVAYSGDSSANRADPLVWLQHSVTRLVDCLFPIVGDFAEFAGADALDGNDYIHPVKVAALTALIGRRLGLNRSATIDLATAAVLMNLGYLTLRRSLMDEPRRLLESEWEEHVHTHPDRGVGLLAQSGLPGASLLTIAQHHERWDGSGYPAGLRGEQICLGARILAVADSYVSLRSVRAHRSGVAMDAALSEIAGGSDALFDPAVVEAFEQLVEQYAGVMRTQRTSQETFGTDVRRPTRGDRSQDVEHVKPAPAALRDDDEEGQDPGERHRRASSPIPVAPAPEPTAPPPTHPATVPFTPATAPAAVSVSASSTRDADQAQRRRVHKPTLFDTVFYLDTAVRGGWSGDAIWAVRRDSYDHHQRPSRLHTATRASHPAPLSGPATPARHHGAAGSALFSAAFYLATVRGQPPAAR